MKLDFDDFEKNISNYNHEHGLSINAKNLLQKLCDANILMTDQAIRQNSIMNPSCNVHFRYSYLYSYFVARYMSYNLGREEVRVNIRKLLNEINIESNSRIVINTWYFSNDNILLQMLHEKINETMHNQKVYDFAYPAKCIISLNNHKGGIKSTLREINNSPEENTRILLDKEEDQSHTAKKDIYTYNNNEFEEESDLSIVEVNTAFNLIATIGQIIRCYGGTIKTDEKIRLIDACYNLGMKSLSFVLSTLDDTSDFINYVQDVLLADTNLSIEDAYQESLKFIGTMVQLSTYGTIMRISEAIATDKMEISLKKYMEEYNKSIGMKLVEIGVVFLFLNKERIKLVEDLYMIHKNDYLVSNILRSIIWRYYSYNFVKSKNDKDRILSILGIKQSGKLIGNVE